MKTREVLNPQINWDVDRKNYKIMENLSFKDKIEEAKKMPIFENVLSNPDSAALKIAEEIIEGKGLMEVYGLTKEDYRNFVKDNGENPAVVAAICIELAERRAKSKTEQDSE